MADKIQINGYWFDQGKITTARDLWDYYPTDPDTIREYFRQFPILLPKTFLQRQRPLRVLDAGMADGRWGILFIAWIVQTLGPEYRALVDLTGVEIQTNPTWVAAAASSFTRIIHADYLDWAQESFANGDQFDVILGNPPFGKPVRNIAEAFTLISLTLLAPRGSLHFLYRNGFLASQRRYGTLWGPDTQCRPSRVISLCARPQFLSEDAKNLRIDAGKSAKGTYPGDYVIVSWQNTPRGLDQLSQIDWMSVGEPETPDLLTMEPSYANSAA
jgi:hypothetical protein